jgi:hypothetical protein
MRVLMNAQLVQSKRVSLNVLRTSSTDQEQHERISRALDKIVDVNQCTVNDSGFRMESLLKWTQMGAGPSPVSHQ